MGDFLHIVRISWALMDYTYGQARYILSLKWFLDWQPGVKERVRVWVMGKQWWGDNLWSSICFCFSIFSILVCSSCVLRNFLLLTLPGSVLVNWVQGAGDWGFNPTLLLVSLKYMKKVWKLGMLLIPWKVQVPEKKYVRWNHIKVTIFEIKSNF